MEEEKKHNTFVCKSCGGDLEYKPGTTVMECPFCKTENEIIEEEGAFIAESDFMAALDSLEQGSVTQEQITVSCESCGAEITFDENITADECPYCGTSIVAQGHSMKTIMPQALLPFKVNKDEARGHFTEWLNKRWFLPNKVKKYARLGLLNGIYSPHWTYDCNTTSHYTGQRGEHYYVTESYTTIEDGKSVTKTRQVRKTRWYPASGIVYNSFDDLLVLASNSLPGKYAEALEPWDLENLNPYNEEYLGGFRVESYSIGLKEGFEDARDQMEPVINTTVRRDIGGDEQRIFSVSVNYEDITFKHILLPVWISAYKFQNETYRFLVNARTGEVQGERPWSWVKITIAILIALLVIAGIIAAVMYSK